MQYVAASSIDVRRVAVLIHVQHRTAAFRELRDHAIGRFEHCGVIADQGLHVARSATKELAMQLVQVIVGASVGLVVALGQTVSIGVAMIVLVLNAKYDDHTNQNDGEQDDRKFDQ